MRTPSLLIICSLFLVVFSAHSSSTNATYLPPDSSANILKKTAAFVAMEQGRDLFAVGKVKDALVQFRSAADQDPYNWRSQFWIGQCHYAMDNYGLALKYANKASQLEKGTNETNLVKFLGDCHHRMGNLDSALVHYTALTTRLNASQQKEQKILQKIAECHFAQAELLSGKSANRQAIPTVNTGYNDYGPLLADGGKTLYFTSRRSDSQGGQNNPDDQQFFEDIYRAVWNPTTATWDSISNELGRINTAGFDAMTYISPDGLYALLSINTEASGNKPKTRSTDIFQVEMTNKGKWSTPKRIANESINTSYFDGAATQTDDGNTLFFVSDRNAGKTSTDIYMVQKIGKSWGKAQALPANINTSGRETTPFITGDGRYLFFSSDGHKGMGGLDIYVAENLGDKWGDPINLGALVNTVNNDTHFRYYPALQKALLSSFTLIDQKASMDIFEIDMTGFTYPTAP